jgi:rubredoxin
LINSFFSHFCDDTYKVIDSVHVKVKKMIWICTVCGWEYNEEEGLADENIAAGTKFEDLPDDFECPVCGAGKDDFEKQ